MPSAQFLITEIAKKKEKKVADAHHLSRVVPGNEMAWSKFTVLAFEMVELISAPPLAVFVGI